MSSSPKAVLASFQENLPKLAELNPKATQNFVKRLMAEAMQDGVLSFKQKEFIALGIAIATACDYCIAIHVKKCFEAGATREELAEVCGVAMVMGGGPAFTYSTFAAQAIAEFAPKG